MEGRDKEPCSLEPDHQSTIDDGNKASFETILERLGMPGRFQLTQLFLGLMSKWIVTFMALSYVFIGYDPPHVCNAVNETDLLLSHDLLNDTTAKIKYGSCHITLSTNHSGDVHDVTRMACLNGRNFSNAKATTYLSEWDLVCEYSGTAEWSQTIFILGQIIGGFINSHISDTFGRRHLFVVSSLLVLVLESFAVFATSIYMIYAIKLFSGFFFQAVLTTYVVHGMELLVPRHRQKYGVVICYFWVAHVIIFGGVAYLLRDYSWRYLQGFIALSGLISVAFPFLFHESPRWLATNGRLVDTLKIMEKASKQNKKDFVHIKELTESFVKSNTIKPYPLVSLDLADDGSKIVNETEIEPTVNKQSLLTLFRNRHLLYITVITWYIWLTCNITYYGLYMTSSSVAGNRFLNYILMSLVEIPANFVILIMLNNLNRRLVLTIFMALSSVSLLASSLFLTFSGNSSSMTYISTALLIFGKFAIGSAFNVIFMLTPELFPTNLRSLGTGFCNGFGRIGSLIAPFFRPLFQVARWAPGVVFTVMCFLALVLIPFLPETKDKALPNNIEDVTREQRKKHRQIWK